ncbi:GDSL-like Lipase/Acylhydrolase [Lacunisphaera limnophila]|uniref:GDSL-like Lipase/Acylhydrolase n=1 Tax=Lacunisphaera limnophila TaxID=1838286 RepID=A0A1D8AUA6_9BACT|nr:GDSL-type esterase/lipase family protein [Lacunisphaera limnophila]AOS44474.1 GDSL-like Lipase/Acylhydrolase [Lacunisphaera limnophila]
MRTPALPVLSLSKGLVLASLLLTASVSAQSVPAAPAPADPRFELPATDVGLPGEGTIRRYDWFKNLWRERRTTFAARVQHDQGAIVFLGDSITQGWHDNFDDAFPTLRTANRGIAGDTTRGVLLRLPEDVIALNPAAVVLLIGTNDLDEPGNTPWTIAANFRLILAALKKHNPAMPVVVCHVMPSSPQKNRPAYLIRRVNRLYQEAVADQPQVTMLDTWKLFAGPGNDATLAEFPDLLHPNNDGYAKWAAALRPIFATLGFLERQNDNFTIENDFVSLFNGHDLTGWGCRATTPEDLKSAQGWQSSSADAAAWPVVKEAVTFDGLKASPDGRFVAKNGRLIVTTPTVPRMVQQLWTTREFPQNFVLRLQFRATPNADSGVYLRGPQLQCRDYLLAGPYTKLRHYRPLDWNDLEVTVKDGIARATCNGEVLEEAMPLPATGPIGLEGDMGQMEYRRIRMMDLP